jgi:hypothetical protein
MVLVLLLLYVVEDDATAGIVAVVEANIVVSAKIVAANSARRWRWLLFFLIS